MKNICKLILTLSLFPLSALALGTPGFDTGNDFQAVRLTGEIHVMCNNHNGGSESAFFQCREEYLSPAEYARFVGPTADADEVVLKATREDGSVREKSGSYLGQDGISKGRFNLWIATLTQRPLLKFGRNLVEFTLKKEGSPVMTGRFEADVKKGEDRYCRVRGSYFSSDLNDCRFANHLCDRYFYEQNYCR